MPKISFLFPGQGAQYPGMGKDFYETFPESKEVFDSANALLDFDLLSLCFTENAELNQTEYTQAAMLSVSEAIRVVLESKGIKPAVVAGLSLGEYNALVASGVLAYQDAVLLVRKRGQLMQNAVPTGEGAMAAVLFMDSTVIEQECRKIPGIVGIANYNSPIQNVISGEKKAVELACQKLKMAGAKKVVPLKVSGPFHSPMLKEAGTDLLEELEMVTVHPSKIPYVDNVTASYIMVGENDGKKVKDSLAAQVASSVRFRQSIEAMIQDGVDTFIEVGPGKTLSGLVKQISKQVKVYSIEKVAELEPLVKALKEDMV